MNPGAPSSTAVTRDGWFAVLPDGKFYAGMIAYSEEPFSSSYADVSDNVERAFFFPTPPTGLAAKALEANLKQPVRFVPVRIQITYTFDQ